MLRRPPSLLLSKLATRCKALTFLISGGFSSYRFTEVDLTEAELRNKPHYQLKLLSFMVGFLFRRSDAVAAKASTFLASQLFLPILFT